MRLLHPGFVSHLLLLVRHTDMVTCLMSLITMASFYFTFQGFFSFSFLELFEADSKRKKAHVKGEYLLH